MRQWVSAVVMVGCLGLGACGVPSTGGGEPNVDADVTGGATEDMGLEPPAPDTAPIFPLAADLAIDRALLVPDMALDAPSMMLPPDAPSMMLPPDAAVPDAPAGNKNGAACAASGDCTSGFCADGVCCLTACTDTCSSCNLTGSIGTCAPRPAGMDPDNECAAESASSCGLDGMCDGKGACRKHATGTECLPGTCTGSSESAARTCDGMGTCRPAATKMCDPFLCDGNVCGTACTVATQCKAPSFCDLSTSKCAGQKAAGAACMGAAECATGNCVDGVCCMTDCKDNCKACNLAGSLGMCVVVPAGQDPRNVCAPEAAATCGLDGQCDGTGACRKHPVGTVCVAPSCAVATFTSARTCDGLGVCRPATTMSCGTYQCMGAACGSGCTVDGDCATGLYCGGGSCLTKKAAAAACARAGECSAGFCADGFCCDSACTVGCRACNISGLVGTCSPVPGGLDPHNACAAAVSTTCGLDGQCDGAGACRFFGAGTPCGTGMSCQNGIASSQLACDGGGLCQPSAGTSCAPYLCANTTACATSCTVDTDCAAGNYCEGTTCVAKKILGLVCGRAAMCALGNCIDAVCCDTACTGACKACNVAGLLGTCSNVVTGQDPDNDCAAEAASTCGRDGMCNGAGACRLHPVGTECVSGTCVAGFQTVQQCDGTGTCQAPMMIACATPIVFRAAASGGAASGTLTLAISVPAGTLANDVMIASIGVRPYTAVITAPAGWTLVRRTDNTSATKAPALAVYYRVAGASEPANYTWTFSASTGSAGGIQSFSGVKTSSPINVDGGLATASSLSHATPSVTTTMANTMLVTSHTFSSPSTWTPPTGMTESLDVVGGGLTTEGNRALQAAAGATGTKTATAAGGSDVGATHILALTPGP